MALGSDYFLCNGNRAADRAVLALGLALGRTGGFHSLVNYFGVTLGGDSLLSNDNRVTDRAVLARSQTGLGTGGFLGSVHHFGMTLGVHIAVGVGIVTAGASVGSEALLGTGGGGDDAPIVMAQSVNSLLSNQNFVTDGAMLALGQAGCGTGGCHCRIDHFGVTQSIHIGIDIAVTTARAGVGGVALLGAGRCGDNRIIAVYVPRCPNAVRLGVGTRAGGGIGTVIIFQLGIGDGDLAIVAVGSHHVSTCLGTIREDDGAVAADIRAAFGGVHSAGACVHGAVDLNLGIHLISGSTVIGLAGGVFHWDKTVAISTAESAPLVGIVNINTVAAAQGAGGARVNNDLGAGLHGNVLIDGNIAAMQVHGQVAVDGQLIVLGVDRGTAYIQRDGRDGHIAIDIHDGSVLTSIIPLHHIAAGQIEHGSAAGDEIHRGGKICFGHINGGIGVFLRAGVQLQRHFDVLDVILGDGENAVFHVCTLAAAPEVRDLEHLVNRRAAVGGDGAGACDKAVGIQRTVHGDAAAAFHPHEAHGAGGSGTGVLTATSVFLLGGNAHSAVNDQVRPVRHGQGAVGGGGGINFLIQGVGGVQAVGIIKGDQQGNARGNGVVPGGQDTIVLQNQRLAAGGCRSCLRRRVQIIIQVGRADLVVVELIKSKQAGLYTLLGSRTRSKPGRSAVLGKYGSDGHIRGRCQGVLGIGGENAVLPVDPAEEGRAAVGDGNQLCAGFQTDGFLSTGSDRFTINSDTATLRVILEGDLGLSGCGYQREVAERQGSDRSGYASIGYQNQSNRSAWLQHRGIAAAGVCRLVRNFKTALVVGFIGKAQLRLIVRGVCNRNCIGGFGPTALCLNGHSAAGYTSVSGTVCDRDLTIQNLHGLGGV